MNTSRSRTTVLAPLALALLLATGAVAAQSKAGSPPQTREEADKAADADKAERGDSDQDPAAKPKADSRKPKRDKSSDDKNDGRELEEEEDI